MGDLLAIFVTERNTLLRALFISFLVVFPFTFLPSVLRNGLYLNALLRRIPESIAYSLGFALLVVIAAVLHNYNSLVARKRIFDKPAFTNLQFHGRLDGIGSIMDELETFLLGRIDKYYFRIGIIEPDLNKFEVAIVPLIDLSENDELTLKLTTQYEFKRERYWTLHLRLSEQELENERSILDELIYLDKLLSDLGAVSLEVDEFQLCAED